MKRNYNPAGEKYKRGVYRTWPIFKWRFCEICRKEFRREWGWSYEAGPFFNDLGQNYYLCRTCCPTWADANRAAREKVHRGPLGAAPSTSSGVQPPAKPGGEK